MGDLGLIGTLTDTPSGVVGTYGQVATIANGTIIPMEYRYIDAAISMRTAAETRPASISSYICIKY
jgi:hypothetical protein